MSPSARDERRAGLTPRGRGLLAGGIAALLCGLILGEPDVLRIGGFLVALPLAAAVLVHRTRFQIGSRRLVQPPRLQAGSEASVRLEVENMSRLPTGVLLFEESLPVALGGRPRFAVDRLPPRARRMVTYSVTTQSRGRYSVGPLTVRLADPFGLCEVTRSFTEASELLVTPVVTPLAPVRLGAEWGGDMLGGRGTVTNQGEDDTTVRAYRDGDELRRVHWRSTARRGELMVRQEAQPWRAGAVILLDTRWSSHTTSGLDSSFEWAVSATASIALDLDSRGYPVQVVTDVGVQLGSRDGADLLDELAVLHTSRREGLAAAASGLRHNTHGLVVAITGTLSAPDVSALIRLGHDARQGVVLLLDAENWTSGGEGSEPALGGGTAQAAGGLEAAGWQVFVIRRGNRLDALWSAVGQRPLFRATRPRAMAGLPGRSGTLVGSDGTVAGVIPGPGKR